MLRALKRPRATPASSTRPPARWPAAARARSHRRRRRRAGRAGDAQPRRGQEPVLLRQPVLRLARTSRRAATSPCTTSARRRPPARRDLRRPGARALRRPARHAHLARAAGHLRDGGPFAVEIDGESCSPSRPRSPCCPPDLRVCPVSDRRPRTRPAAAPRRRLPPLAPAAQRAPGERRRAGAPARAPRRAGAHHRQPGRGDRDRALRRSVPHGVDGRVLVHASDLAAVGAEPIGMLHLRDAAAGADATVRRQVCRPASRRRPRPAGCRCSAATPTSPPGCRWAAPPWARCPTARGHAAPVGAARRPALRRGPLGGGSAFAFLAAARAGAAAASQRPSGRSRGCARGGSVRTTPLPAMDTSDGACRDARPARAAQRRRLHGGRARGALLHADAVAVAAVAGLPAWTLLAGPHGEFELLFTVPAARERRVPRGGRRRGLGTGRARPVTAERAIRVPRCEPP